MYNGKTISFVTTTYRRIDLLKKMVESLKNIDDFNLVDKFYILDDGSDKEDIEWMKTVKGATVIKNNSSCQQKNLNNIFNIDTDYLLLIEDDVVITRRDSYIMKSISIIEKLGYDQVMLSVENEGHYFGKDVLYKGMILKEREFDPNDRLFKLFANNEGLGPYDGNQLYWPKFFLMCSMIDLGKLKSYNEVFREETHFERRFGFRIVQKGFRNVCLPPCAIHIGKERSTYVGKSK